MECQSATRQNPLALAFVPEFEQTPDIVIPCIRRDFRAIHFVHTLHLDILQSWIIAHPEKSNAQLARWYPPWTPSEIASLDSSVFEVHTAAIPHIQAFASISMFTHYCGLPELDPDRFLNAAVQTDSSFNETEASESFDDRDEAVDRHGVAWDWSVPVNRKRRLSENYVLSQTSGPVFTNPSAVRIVERVEKEFEQL